MGLSKIYQKKIPISELCGFLKRYTDCKLLFSMWDWHICAVKHADYTKLFVIHCLYLCVISGQEVQRCDESIMCLIIVYTELDMGEILL